MTMRRTAVLIGSVLTLPVLMPTLGALHDSGRWLAVTVDLSAGPVDVAYRALVDCNHDDPCLGAMGYVGATALDGASLAWSTRPGIRIDVSTGRAHLEQTQTYAELPPPIPTIGGSLMPGMFLDRPLPIELRGTIALDSAFHGTSASVILFGSADHASLEIVMTPPEREMGRRIGEAVSVLFPSDFDGPLNIGGNVGIGPAYRKHVVPTEGMLGIFSPWWPPFTVDAAVTSPTSYMPCRFYQYQVFEHGTNCVDQWVMDGPPGPWTFEVVGRAQAAVFSKADIPLLVWTDAPPLGPGTAARTEQPT